MLVGVIHLPALPGSPRGELTASVCAESAAKDAAVLAAAGYDAIIVENFGDAPFYAGRVPPITIAAMTACALAVRAAAPETKLGINVLRNDGESALAIAVATGAAFVRINVHTGARVTDQGIIQGDAASTLRLRRSLGAEAIEIWADVDVKHSAPLAPSTLAHDADDLATRGLADAVLVTGSSTGKGVVLRDLEEVLGSVRVPVLVASGVTPETLFEIRRAHGVVVGSCLRASGRAGDPIDRDRAMAFADAFRAVWLHST